MSRDVTERDSPTPSQTSLGQRDKRERLRAYPGFFKGGGGGHTGSSNIVMAFSPRNIVGRLLKKGLQRGGHGHPRTPLATPLRLGTRLVEVQRVYLRSDQKNSVVLSRFTVSLFPSISVQVL